MYYRTQETLEALSTFHYPTYDELPHELVFMDDMVSLIAKVHSPISFSVRHNKPFTSSMARNYIKQGLTPPPIGKKYSRQHVCILLLAASMKLTYKAAEVLEITRAVFDGVDSEEEFAQIQNHISMSINTNMHRLGRIENNDTVMEFRDRDMLVELVSAAFVAKVASLMVIANE